MQRSCLSVRTLALAAMVALGSVSSARAAGIFSQGNFTGDTTSGISSAKTYTLAVDVNGTGETINGVPFAGITSTTGGTDPTHGGSYTATGITASFTGLNSNATGNIHQMLSDFYYGGNPGTVTLTGLTPSTTYTTVFYCSSFGNAGTRVQNVTTSDGGAVSFDENQGSTSGGSATPSVPVYLQYTYTTAASGANSTSEAFTFSPVNSGNTFHFYGFSNEVGAVGVPEPASLSLLGLGGLGLLARRRRA